MAGNAERPLDLGTHDGVLPRARPHAIVPIGLVGIAGDQTVDDGGVGIAQVSNGHRGLMIAPLVESSRAMASRVLVLDYDGERVTFDVEGETSWGAPGVLLDQDDNLVAGRPWADAGFSVEPFLAPSDYDRLVAGIQACWSGASRPRGCRCHPASRWIGITMSSRPTPRIARFRIRAPGVTASRTCPVAGRDDQRAASARSSECASPPRLRTPISPSISASASSGPAAATTTRRIVMSGSIACATRSTSTCRSRAARRVRRLPLVRGSHRWAESEIERTVEGARVNGIVFTVPSVVGAAHPLSLRAAGPRSQRGAGLLAVPDSRRRVQSAAGSHPGVPRNAVLAPSPDGPPRRRHSRLPGRADAGRARRGAGAGVDSTDRRLRSVADRRWEHGSELAGDRTARRRQPTRPRPEAHTQLRRTCRDYRGPRPGGRRLRRRSWPAICRTTRPRLAP